MPTVKTIKVNYNMKLLASLCVVIMFLQCLRKEKKGEGPSGGTRGGYGGHVSRDEGDLSSIVSYNKISTGLRDIFPRLAVHTTYYGLISIQYKLQTNL